MKPGERRANPRRLPDGAAFMPQMRLKRLEKIIGREREGAERSRLQAARMRKEETSIRGDCRRAAQTVLDDTRLACQVAPEGPRGRFDKRRGRRKRILDNRVLRKLKEWLDEDPAAHGFKSSDWHLDMILDLLRLRAGVECSGRTLERALRRMHFSYRKISRSVPHNSASEEEQEAFMVEAGIQIAGLRGREYAVFAGEGWPSQLWTGNGYAWRPAGRRDVVTMRLAGGAAKAFCALGEGAVRVMPADSADSEGFLRFLKAPVSRSGSYRRKVGVARALRPDYEAVRRGWPKKRSSTATSCGDRWGKTRRSWWPCRAGPAA